MHYRSKDWDQECFLKSLLCSPRLHLFDQKYSKTVILGKIITFKMILLIYFKMQFIPGMAKLNF